MRRGLRALRAAFRSSALPVLILLTRLPLLGDWLLHPAGVLALAAGQPALAEPALAAALSRRRGWTRTIHRHLGKAQLDGGRPDAAEGSLRAAVSLDPADRHNRLWLAETLLRRGRADEAEALLRGLLAEGVQRRWLLLMLVHALMRQGRAQEAIDALVAAASRPDTDIGEIPFPDYLLSSEVGTREQAAALASVVERHPRQRKLSTFQARLLARLGDYQASTRILCRASGRAAGSPGKPPAFLIIGQAKAGTTALFDWLLRHPDIRPPVIKEIHYWTRFRDADMAWYLAHFPSIPIDSRPISGEASTDYLGSPAAPAAVARDLPGARLICLLREPVARAYSEYRMFQRLGWERRPWEQVVTEELKRCGACPLTVAELDARLAQGPPGYLLHSAALPHLLRWSALFPPERLLILDSGALFADPAATLARVWGYLGLPVQRLGAVAPVNEGHYPPMTPALARRLRDWFAPHQRALEIFRKEHCA